MSVKRVVGLGIAAIVLASPVAYFIAAARHSQAGPAAARAALDPPAPLPASVPPGTRLTVGDPTTEAVLKHNGWDKALPFEIKWLRITGGPAVTEAFHARALDVGLAADMPPIHATWVGIPVKTIAVALRRDPLDHPSFELAIGPKAGVTTLADLRGKRLAFSPGQVQGEIVLRTLREQGLSKSDVTLVEMPSTSADVYVNALAAGLVDVAPIASGVAARRYLADYAKDGAKVLRHGAFPDDLINLYVRTETLSDPAKAAALLQYVKLWARAQAWIDAHPDEWARLYYVGQQGLSDDDARYVVRASGTHDIPVDWTGAIVRQQATVDLMARETGRKRFDSTTLFDRRFEPVAGQAFAAASAQAAVRMAQEGPARQARRVGP